MKSLVVLPISISIVLFHFQAVFLGAERQLHKGREKCNTP